MQAAELGGQDARKGDGFGYSVAISGNKIVVGDPSYSKRRGRVYVFSKTATGWCQTAALERLSFGGGRRVGWAVGVSGSTIVVGVPESEALSGTAYVFTEKARRWKQVVEFNPSNTITGSNFGDSVAISGTTIVVRTSGTPGCSVSVGGGPSRPVPASPRGKPERTCMPRR